MKQEIKIVDMQCLYAFVSRHEDGTEGVVAYKSDTGWMPLVGGTMKRMEAFWPHAETIAKIHKSNVKLVCFSNRMELETIIGG